MADVFTVAAYAEIFGAILVVGGLTFAVLELRRNREQNRRDAAFQMFQGLGTQEFLSGIKLLYTMPEGLSKTELEQQYGEELEQLHWVLYQFENLATMVFNGMIDLDLAEEFYAVSIVNVWVKLKDYIIDLREQANKPNLHIYVQRLAEMVMERHPNEVGFTRGANVEP